MSRTKIEIAYRSGRGRPPSVEINAKIAIRLDRVALATAITALVVAFSGGFPRETASEQSAPTSVEFAHTPCLGECRSVVGWRLR